MKTQPSFFVVAVLGGILLLTAQGQYVQPGQMQPSTVQVQPTMGQQNLSWGTPDDNRANTDIAAQAMANFMPFMDPGSETVSWNGMTWNVNNQRFFQARLEKFLNAPAATDAEEMQYQEIIEKVQRILLQRNVPAKHLDAAFKMLTEASYYEADAHLFDSLITAIYSSWASANNQAHLTVANRLLEEKQKKENWNMMMTARSRSVSGSNSGQGSTAASDAVQSAKEVRMSQHTARLLELKTLVEANKVKKEISELKSKLEFQSLILQYFTQRRFQHVLVASGFYRHVFREGRSELHLEGDAKDMFANSTGLPPTINTLETVAREAMRDVRQGVDAYYFLLDQNELESATKRLAETFWIGEYLPELRTIPREKKRQALKFTQKYYQLLSALDVKDYTLAEELVNDLSHTARDFDSSKPMAAIETAKVIASMRLAQAKNAAMRGDSETLETELKEATKLWPRNPELKDVAGMIFNSGDVQQQALIDFDRLLAQKNYRQIFEDRARYIAAVSVYPERQDELKQVLENIQMIEASIIRSQEMAKRGLYPGAWETVEKAYTDFSEDNKLNQVRADLTTKASNFVRAIRRAEELELEEKVGSSLAWYLKAQSLYPDSEYAQDGIQRLAQEILPDGMMEEKSVIQEEVL